MRSPQQLQACAVPYRREGTTLRYLLITSSGGDSWIFPKGIVDPGSTPEQTALNEALEEAGVRGLLSAAPMARFGRHKWGREWDVIVYALSCEEVADDWLESWRERRWVSYDEAQDLLDQPLRRVLRAIHRVLTGAEPIPDP